MSVDVRKAAATISGLGTVALVYAAAVERRWFTLRHATLPVLAAGASSRLRVLHVSDLHLLPWQRDKLAFVRGCVASSPDVVVATGDLLGHPAAVDPAVETLTEIARGRVAVAVLGSNDFYAPVLKNPLHYLVAPGRRRLGTPLDTPRLVDGLTAGGFHVLENRRVTVATRVGALDVAGLGDPHIGRDDPAAVDWTPPLEAPALRLGVVHAPYRRALDVFAAHGYDLVLAGHTHGGQLRVPGIGALVTNCDLPRRQARGLSRHDGSWLYVSAGLGTSMYAPVRFACRPEATVLDLVPTRH